MAASDRCTACACSAADPRRFRLYSAGMARYKVRLDDGSEINLELQAVKDWYTQGLLTRDSPVLKPGSSQWVPLVRALQLVEPSAGSPKPAPGPSPPPFPRPRAGGEGSGLAARVALLVVVGGGAVFGAWQLLGRGESTAQAPPPTLEPRLSLDQLRAQSVEVIAREVPLFPAATADRLVRSSEAQAMAPEEAFRRGFSAAARGASSLPATEAREMSSLTSTAYSRVSAKERSLMGAYLGKVRIGRPTTQAEDREASAIMKRALQGFPAARLARIQQLYAKAIESGLSR